MKHSTEYSEIAKPPGHASSIKRYLVLVLKRSNRTELPDHPAQRLSSKMDSQRTHQTVQPFSNQATVQRSELNHLLLGNFPDGEAQNVFSYLPSQQISQMFLQPSYDPLVMRNGLEGYTWPDQDTTINQAVGDPREPLQAHTSVQLQSVVVDHATNSQGLRPSPSGLDDRLTGFEDRISGLEMVIQNLRNE
jgi:hypothetical protein